MKLSPVPLFSRLQGCEELKAKDLPGKGRAEPAVGDVLWAVTESTEQKLQIEGFCCLPVLHCLSVSYCRTSGSMGKTFPIASFLRELLNSFLNVPATFLVCFPLTWACFSHPLIS